MRLNSTSSQNKLLSTTDILDLKNGIAKCPVDVSHIYIAVKRSFLLKKYQAPRQTKTLPKYYVQNKEIFNKLFELYQNTQFNLNKFFIYYFSNNRHAHNSNILNTNIIKLAEIYIKNETQHTDTADSQQKHDALVRNSIKKSIKTLEEIRKNHKFKNLKEAFNYLVNNNKLMGYYIAGKISKFFLVAFPRDVLEEYYENASIPDQSELIYIIQHYTVIKKNVISALFTECNIDAIKKYKIFIEKILNKEFT